MDNSLEISAIGHGRVRMSAGHVPISGTSKLARVEENIAATTLELTAQDLRTIDEIVASVDLQGSRYPAALEQMTNHLNV